MSAHASNHNFPKHSTIQYSTIQHNTAQQNTNFKYSRIPQANIHQPTINSTYNFTTMNKAVSCEKAPKAIGPYSQAIEANGTIYVSGQLPIDATTGNFVEGGIKEQCRQSLTNIGYILNQAGYTYKDVVKCTVYLANIADFAAANEVYATFFSEPYPARVAFQAAALPKNALVEIDAIAVK